MDFTGGVLFIFLFFIFIDCIRDMQTLVIPANKNKIETVLTVISTIILLSITYLFASRWYHYIIGILGASIPILSWKRKGINNKGFRSIARLGYWSNWNNLKKVEVSLGNQIKVTFHNRYLHYDTHYYEKEDYNEIITLLHENMPDVNLFCSK
ncbi:MAG: hypothetical protein ACOWWR_17265 [Eubacteriales bacterium]